MKQKQTIKNNSFLGFAPVFENGQTIDMASRAADFIVDSLYRSIDNEQFVSLPNTAKEINEITKMMIHIVSTIEFNENCWLSYH